MATTKMLLAAGLLAALSFSVALAAVVPLQDFCVTDPKAQALVKGVACKDPKLVVPEDFFTCGADKPGNTSNAMGYKVTSFNVAQIPGLNTLGISMVRVDYAQGGVNPPHTHPRASEIFTVLEGNIEVGFITGNPELRHIKKVLQKGDVFVFPFGLIHYQRNMGTGNAAAIAAFNSQYPGMIPIAGSVFHSKPGMNDEMVAKTFQMDEKVVESIQTMKL